jgi:hypothetical protein
MKSLEKPIVLEIGKYIQSKTFTSRPQLQGKILRAYIYHLDNTNATRTAAFDYAKKNDRISEDNLFKELCGVGVEVDGEQIKVLLAEMVSEQRDAIAANVSKASGMFMKLIRSHPRLKWADMMQVKKELEAILAVELETINVKQAANANGSKAKAVGSNESIVSEDAFFKQGELGKLHKPGKRIAAL